jgi:predicted anti-sigma-YlaC factor YlaD
MTQDVRVDCGRVLQQVSDYLDQELAAATCSAIEAHCAQCQSCRDVVEGLRRTVGLCRESRTRPLPPAVKAKAQAAIRTLLGQLESNRGADLEP